MPCHRRRAVPCAVCCCRMPYALRCWAGNGARIHGYTREMYPRRVGSSCELQASPLSVSVCSGPALRTPTAVTCARARAREPRSAVEGSRPTQSGFKRIESKLQPRTQESKMKLRSRFTMHDTSHQPPNGIKTDNRHVEPSRFEIRDARTVLLYRDCLDVPVRPCA